MTEPARTPSDLRAEYVGRVNRVIDHIERNLDRSLSLDELARVARFSPHHFHRIFSALVGETLHRFIQRLRVERAATMLVTNAGCPITAIAIDCGFSSSATFARAFKEAFGMSATRWRAQGDHEACKANRKIRKTLDGLCKAGAVSDCYLDPRNNAPTWRIEMPAEPTPLHTTVQVQTRAEIPVVYLRHVGPYGQTALVPRLVAKLRQWAVPRGLWGPDTRTLLVAHDDPNVTEEGKLRLSVCLSVPPQTEGEGEVGRMTIAGGKYAVGHFEIRPEQIAEAWGAVLGGWLPQSGFQPDDRLCYEEALGDPREHPEGKIVLDICVPVRPL
jgi:AraC family transcriptional regulator